MKKLFAVLLTLTLVLSMGTIALAADGKITIENAIDGENYTIYKIFDFAPVADSDNGRYSYANDKWKTFVETLAGKDYLSYDADVATIEWIGDTLEDGITPDPIAVAALAKEAVAYAKTNNLPSTTIEAEDTTVVFSGLDLGYYAVDTSLGAICALTNTNSEEKLIEKNEQPTIVKKIIEGDTLVDANNVAIGEKVEYQISVTASKGTVNYVIHDTLSDTLELDATTIVVKNGNTALTKNTDYTLAVPGTTCKNGCTFEIDLADTYELNTLKAGDIITVTYSATLKANAKIGSEGNPNQVHLTYGHAQETDKDTVLTYTTKYTVEKVDGNGNPLAGAGFTLYKYDATVEGDDKWVAIGEQKLIESLDEGAKAIYEWNGLAEGQYKLVETKVPDGYNQAKDIEFTITCTELTDGRTEVTSVTDTADWSDDSDDVNEENETFNSEVQNLTGTLLPETGGIGTTIFYVVGGLLMAAAFILLVSKKRMASFA